MNFTMKQLSIAFVIVSLSFLWSLSMLQTSRDRNTKLEKQKSELKKQVDSLEVLSDSLQVELFPAEVELTRYQVAYEIFLKRNPKAASQFGDIISDETE